MKPKIGEVWKYGFAERFYKIHAIYSGTALLTATDYQDAKFHMILKPDGTSELQLP